MRTDPAVRYPYLRNEVLYIDTLFATLIEDDNITIQGMGDTPKAIEVFYYKKSRILEVTPIDDKSANTVRDALDSVIRKHGIPSKLVADFALENRSEAIRQLRNKFGMNAHWSEPYHQNQNRVE